MTISPLTPFSRSFTPVNNVTPFTYRDGATYLEILYALITYINDTLVGQIEATLTQKLLDFAAELQAAKDDITTTKEEWETRWDTFMADVTAQLAALNDAAMAGLILNNLSATRAALQSVLNDYLKIVAPSVLWVDPVAGNDDNEGSNALPIKTINEAFARIEKVAQDSNSEWVINLEPGVYTERVRPSAFTPFGYKVTIAGPDVAHPVVPMVTFTEGMGAVAVGMFFSNPLATVTVKDIKFAGYNGSTSACGINSVEGWLNTVNVHAEFCYFAISGSHGTHDAVGGILQDNGCLNGQSTGNGAAIRSLFQNHHSIGNQFAGDNTQGPFFYRNQKGIFAQESSTGHADWCLFEDNVNAIECNISSRVNTNGSSFKRNSTDVLLRGNSHANIADNNTFGTGADASGQICVAAGGSQAPTTRALDVDMSYARTEQVFWGNWAQQEFTGSTATRDVFSRTVDAPWWNSTVQVGGTAPKRLIVRARGNVTGVAGTKQFALRLGSLIASITLAATEAGDFAFDGEILFVSPTRQIVNTKMMLHLADSQRVDNSAGSVDLTTDQTVRLTIADSDAADTVTFESVEILFG